MLGDVRDRRKAQGNGLLFGILIVVGLYFAREVFIPLALAGLVAFLLAPVATRLERLGLQRTLAGLLVIGLSFAAVCTVCWVVMGQIYNLAVELPQYQQNVTQKIDALHLRSTGKLASTVEMLSAVGKQISKGGSDKTLTPAPTFPVRRGRSAAAKANPNDPKEPPAPIPVRVEADSSILEVASRNVEPLIHPLTTAFVVVVFVIFMLLARDDIRDRAVRLAGSSRIHITTVAMTDASARVSRYLLMQFLVNVTYGGVVGLGLMAIGVPHPLLWAVTTTLLRFIPYVGILAAGTGPLLMALAVSPGWGMVAWTFGMYVALELISANAVEPHLYGSSTGVSALAILVAAIFWTWLWGLAGLLLSTPLTVCLIVLGRHFPRMEFLGVLFGEEKVLAPAQRLYQRILAGDTNDAAKLIEEQEDASPRQEVYDGVLIPALSLIEDARHSEEINTARADRALQSFEELVEEQWSRASQPRLSGPKRHKLVCVPARDFADEITCRLLMHLASESYEVRLLSADLQTVDVLEEVGSTAPDVVCVVAIPPQAIRHVRLRCHQLRARFPEMTVIAGVLSTECDLSNIRGRIPLEDAQHVACSLLQAMEYLTALANPAKGEAAAAPIEMEAEAHEAELLEATADVKAMDLLDDTQADIFDRVTKNLAKTFDAPIAILSVNDGDRAVWRSQCGLPEHDEEEGLNLRDLTICHQPMVEGKPVVVPDTAEDPRFSKDVVLQKKGIRFYAGAPIVAEDGREIGSLCVLDTRPRQVTEQQTQLLVSLADAVTNAVALQTATQGEEPMTEAAGAKG